ncbi:flagellar hook capping FlgD N-terminal domain-containing protein [Dyella silvatica]|uniref:flagellar hook capping FlgD N-terminal domain-containing protein n=1 Tax=Dyella silvatica TaxID=2992128 RepID=UPI00225AD5B4|nr:flagellar hook capping FlgD N-terminal domain-containing protein [Dyella silvatica]
MAVDSIGAVLGASNATSGVQQKAINQNDFIKLFVSELQFQDPMQPLDNSQFLLQLSQFESIELSSETNQGVQDMLTMNSSSQSISLLNHPVQVTGMDGSTTAGKISAVSFTTGGVQLSVTASNTGTVMTGVRLSQINLVQP